MEPAAQPQSHKFRPSDYSDLQSLRKAYSHAYAEFLRHPDVELLVDAGTTEQLAVIDGVKTARSSEANRGQRSFLPEVNNRGKACSLKRHFGTGCLRQIVGYAEKLAAQDPERFIWVRDWQKTARKGRNGDSGVYGLSQIKRSRLWLEACGFLIPARRSRNGVMRSGWIVTKHDDLASITGRRCRVEAEQKFSISPRGRGEQMDRYINGENDGQGTYQGTFQGALNSPPRDLPRDYPRDFETDSEGLSNGGKQLIPERIFGSIENIARPNPVIPVNPVIKEPSHPSQPSNLVTAKQTASSRSTPTSKSSAVFMTGNSKADSTGGEGLGEFKTDKRNIISPSIVKESKPVCGADLEDLPGCLGAISDGLLDFKYIERYSHKPELLECCQRALAEPAWHDPAHRMARAMEMMRENYDMDVPAGWIPVMQQLRARGKTTLQKDPVAATYQPTEAYPAPKRGGSMRGVMSEETAAWLEYEAWEDTHGTYDGFIPSNPDAFLRAREMELIERRNRFAPTSRDYVSLSVELEQLQKEALAESEIPF